MPPLYHRARFSHMHPVSDPHTHTYAHMHRDLRAKAAAPDYRSECVENIIIRNERYKLTKIAKEGRGLV